MVRTWITTTEEHTKEMRRLQSNILSSPRSDERTKCQSLKCERNKLNSLWFILVAKTEMEDRMAAIKMTSGQIRLAMKGSRN